ncbi:type VI secretion system-associated FHA domain protein TagH, partial [Noviherbaspirillum sp.]|uniref:type VI secretion system-associated FHA domain protein TagH n=1 Tax=Noviherbaspirillum sp. TaxID=1926288 RepID=UPI002FE21DC5
LAALLAGAGLKEAPRDLVSGKQLEMDEQTMMRLGRLMRLFAQGVIDLLAARTTLKSEMHAAVTVIASQGNNPLKFSPEATSALAYLLAASTPRGFMKPETAVLDAMNDLLAHEVGVVAGMRAALEGILDRFRPAELETRLASRSRLGGGLVINRKARLWEQFEALYSEVSREAQDDFEALFSDAFVKSYEEQIRILEEHHSGQLKR